MLYYIQFNMPNSEPYQYFTITNGCLAKTEDYRKKILFPNKEQARLAGLHAVNTYHVRCSNFTIKKYKSKLEE